MKKQLISSLASQIKELEEQIVEKCKFIDEKNKELDAIHVKIKMKKKEINDRDGEFKQNVPTTNDCDEIEQINEEIKALLERNIKINDESRSAHEQVEQLCDECKLQTKDCGVMYEQLERICDERKKLSQELARLNQEVNIPC